MQRNRSCNSFFMVNIARGMDRVRPDDETTSTRNMAAMHDGIRTTEACSLDLQRTYFILDIHVMVS